MGQLAMRLDVDRAMYGVVHFHVAKLVGCSVTNRHCLPRKRSSDRLYGAGQM